MSRLADRVSSAAHRAVAAEVRAILATWSENEELIRLGAYRKGGSAEVDRAIALRPALDAFLRQDVDDTSDLATAVAAMTRVIGTG